MAPLRSKINHTLHKINDKIKRHSGRSGHLQEEQGAADAKQPRTLQADGLLVSSPGQGGSAVPQGTGTSSSRTEAQVSQLPRTSSGSSSAMSIAESPATYGFDATSPARSSMSVEFLGQKSTAIQASTTSATPLGTLGNPIGTCGLDFSPCFSGRGSCTSRRVCVFLPFACLHLFLFHFLFLSPSTPNICDIGWHTATFVLLCRDLLLFKYIVRCD